MREPLSAGERRRDIEGLRAIGMTLVVVCHIWVGKVSGGVDVFFVLSAYLMTRSLLGRMDGVGKIDFLGFWARIILRICPVAFFILLLTLLAGLLYEPISLWRSFALHGWMALLQLENLQLLRESTDYLARSDPASPFQQYWALSTQMQFYGFLPFWLWLVSRTAKAVRGRYDDRQVLAIGFAILGLASFIFALWILALNPAPHYFNPAARLWEFLAGCLCACLPRQHSLKGRAGGVAVTVGLSLILLCVWIVPVDAPYPGLAALVPVTGAVLVLLSASSEPNQALARRFLEHPALQRLARISFAFYLAHWPILVFYQEHAGTTHLSLVQGAMVIIGALCLAIVAQRFVEEPGRAFSSNWLRPISGRPAYVRAIGAALLMALPAACFLLGWQWHYGAIARDYMENYKVAQVTGPIERFDTKLPADIDRQLIAAKGMLPEPYFNGCDTGPHSSEVRVCTVGNPDSKAFTMLLIGGSHSTQWYPALKLIAERQRWRLLTITKSACPIDGIYIGPRTAGGQVEACRVWARAAVQKAISLHPDLVITTATRPGTGNVGEIVPSGFVKVWSRFTSNDIKVLAIRDNPRPETYSIPECVDRHRRNFPKCNIERLKHICSVQAIYAVLNFHNIAFWDIADKLCGQWHCPAVQGGILLYNDNSHMSVPFIVSLRFLLEKRIKSMT